MLGQSADQQVGEQQRYQMYHDTLESIAYHLYQNNVDPTEYDLASSLGDTDDS